MAEAGFGSPQDSARYRFFLDESGSSGDVAQTGKAFDFAGQQIFVLAAIGTPDDAALQAELERLGRHYALRSGEIKSAALVRTPGFAHDLAAYLARADCPIFVEVMDKRYLIVANFINQVLMPPVPGFDERQEARLMRAMLADVMFETLPLAVLAAFADACQAPSRADVASVFEALCRWAADTDMLGQFQDVVVRLAADSKAEFDEDRAADAHLAWLPLPDKSVTGRSIAMLPGLSALTNIYARINKFRAGALADVALIHDEHMLYGGILSDAKRLMEQLSATVPLPRMPNADYHLREHAELSFAKSQAVPGVQAADVLGGFIMRYMRDRFYGRRPSADRDRAWAKIMTLSRPAQARGLNFVAPPRYLQSLGHGWS